jgi:prepilin peptidase CpaA
MNAYIFDYISMILLVVVLIACSITDLRSQRIPNVLTYPTIVVALLYYLSLNGLDGFISSALGLMTGTCLLIVPYLMGGMGAGDAKLMGAVGAIVGVKGVIISFLLTAMIGGIYALLLIITKRYHFKGFLSNQLHKFIAFILTGKISPDDTAVLHTRPRLCYGLAIALGSIIYITLNLTGYTFPI